MEGSKESGKKHRMRRKDGERYQTCEQVYTSKRQQEPYSNRQGSDRRTDGQMVVPSMDQSCHKDG